MLIVFDRNMALNPPASFYGTNAQRCGPAACGSARPVETCCQPVSACVMREPAQIGVRHQPDLAAGQLQHRALLVGQHDRRAPPPIASPAPAAP